MTASHCRNNLKTLLIAANSAVKTTTKSKLHEAFPVFNVNESREDIRAVHTGGKWTFLSFSAVS